MSSSHRPRISVRQDAVLARDGMEDMGCTIIDVSAEGFRLKVPRAVPSGEYVLTFGGKPYRVEVRWATLDEAGGLFCE